MNKFNKILTLLIKPVNSYQCRNRPGRVLLKKILSDLCIIVTGLLEFPALYVPGRVDN